MREEGSCFIYNVRGEVVGGGGFEGDDLYVNYCFTQGPDWDLVAGVQEAVSQITRQSAGTNRKFVWNFPIDVTFTSTNPSGWPQIVLNVYGKSFLGHEVIKGYAATHLPITTGEHTERLKCFTPASASTLQEIVSWITGNVPEFVDPKMVAQGRGREVTRVKSQGYIDLKFTVVMKDFSRLGYDNGEVVVHSESSLISNTFSTSSMLEALQEERTDPPVSEIKEKETTKNNLNRRRFPISEPDKTPPAGDSKGRSKIFNVSNNAQNSNDEEVMELVQSRKNIKPISPTVKVLRGDRRDTSSLSTPGTSGIHQSSYSSRRQDENDSSEESFDDSSDLQEDLIQHNKHTTQVHMSSPLPSSPPVKLPKKMEPSPNRRTAFAKEDTLNDVSSDEPKEHRRSTAFEAFNAEEKRKPSGSLMGEITSDGTDSLHSSSKRTMDLFSVPTLAGPSPLPRKSLPALAPIKPKKK